MANQIPYDIAFWAQTQIATWVRAAIKDFDPSRELRLPEIADAAVVHFKNDQTFLDGAAVLDEATARVSV